LFFYGLSDGCIFILNSESKTQTQITSHWNEPDLRKVKKKLSKRNSETYPGEIMAPHYPNQGLPNHPVSNIVVLKLTISKQAMFELTIDIIIIVLTAAAAAAAI
jgi:hypothetical protein